MHFNPFFGAYVGQPDSHIVWATVMPFTSIYPIYPRTNLWNFHEKIMRIGRAGKIHFFSFTGLFKNIFFIFSQLKSKSLRLFIWGSVYFCTLDGFFRILKKALSELCMYRGFSPYANFITANFNTVILQKNP